MMANARIIFILWISWVAPSAGRECFIAGECNHSFQIAGKLVDNQYLCRKECQLSPYCNWFTYYKEASYCELYRNCLDLDDKTCPDCLTGEKECSAPEIKCWLTGKCAEDPLSTNFTQTSEECLNKCKETPECNWFTFDERKHLCQLFVNCTDLAGCDSCISANSECQSESQGTCQTGLTKRLKFCHCKLELKLIDYSRANIINKF